MLICGPSGSGKTKTLIHMLIKPVLHFDKIYLYAKNLEQDKYQELIKTFQLINEDIEYDIIETSNNEIIPVSKSPSDNQKIVIFDDFVTEKNQKPLVDYFIQGRHKNCSVIYLSQSYFKNRKKIRLNCSHYCIFDLQSNNEINLVCRENNISKDQYMKATQNPYSFLYIDKPRRFISKNCDEPL